MVEEGGTRSETTAGIRLWHLFFQQTVRMREENLVHAQAARDQWRGSSMSLVKMLRIRSSDKVLNMFGFIFWDLIW